MTNSLRRLEHLETKVAELAKLINLGMKALPIDDDEWGSHRQITAENKFHEYAKKYGVKYSQKLSDYLLKATTEEAVEEVLKRSFNMKL